MKKILWTSLFWIVIGILFWAYIRLFNQDLGAKLSYCLMSSAQTETENVDYEADILLINQQLMNINDKVENILQTLGAQVQQDTPTTLPINSVNSLFDTQMMDQ